MAKTKTSAHWSSTMSNTPLPEPDWLHLKPFGYAPGNYMNRCRWCDKTVTDVDKLARCCRPCAEKLHAQAAAVSADKDARIKVLEEALRGVMGYAWCEYRSNSRPHFDRVYAAARAALGDKND